MKFFGPLLLTLMLLVGGSPSHADQPQAWSYWLPSNAQNTQIIDHSAWQVFLDQYVASNPDGVNRVLYQRARSDQAATQLHAYIDSLSQIDPRQLNRQEQMAYWINLYNAATVGIVLSQPDKKSIQRMGKGLFSFGPWDDPVASITEQTLTLNDIEHRILRPIWQDRRIHFAVNCASLGCPNLSSAAFRSDNLDAQLADAEKAYINHPRGVAFDRKGRLTLSSIFDWYQEDFANNTAELLNYLAAHHTSQAKELTSYTGKLSFAYDWSLNAAQ